MNLDLPISPIFFAIVQMFAMFSLGAFFRHLGYIREADLDKWSHLLIDCLLPCLVFHAMVKGLQVDRLTVLWPLPVIGFGMIFLGAVLGYGLRYGLRTNDPDVIKTFHHFCAVNNYGYLPIIIVQNLWGEAMLANLFLLNVGSTLAYWTIGVWLLGADKWRRALRNVISPNLIALLLGLLAAMSGMRDWFGGTGFAGGTIQVFLATTEMVGSAAVPLLLLVIGAVLYGSPRVRQWRDMTYLSVVRLLLLPALIILVMRQMQLVPEVYQLSVIVALMPVGTTTTVLTRRYGGSSEFAGQAAVATTLAAAATIPLAIWLMQRLW